jgi:hypothetical protein
VFAQPWTDRLKACLAQVNPEVLWAQHRYALMQCFNAHDYDQLNRSAAPNAKVVAARQAYDCARGMVRRSVD